MPDEKIPAPEKDVRFSQQYRAFRQGGLGIFDSFYNALYMVACEKAEQKSGPSAETPLLRFLSAVPRAFRSFFRVFTPSFWKKEKRSDLYRRRGAFLKRHLPLFLVLAVAVFVFLFIFLRLDDPIVLGVEIDGKRVALVQNEEIVRTCVEELEENVESILGRDFTFPHPIRYVFTSLSGKMTLTEKAALSDVLYGYVSDYICTASGLYLDDALAAVVPDRATAESALAAVLAEKRRESGNAELEIYNEITILDQAYPTSALMQKDELIAYLKQLEIPFEERENASVPAVSDDVETVRPVFSNGSLYADTQLATTTVVRHHSNYPQSSTTLHLAFVTTEVIEYEMTVPYVTVYEESPQFYTTMTERTQEGADGRERIQAKIYWVEGKEARREILNTTVLKAPKNEIYSIGIRVLPEDLGIVEWRGRFIKPHETNISSGFGYRRLDDGGLSNEFHAGVDLPGKEGEPIYAPASGTVIGYRIAEDAPAETVFPGRTYTGYGLFVLIRHDEHHVTLCAHCSKVCVELGQEVKQGDKIAELGNTGFSFGAHCHFEVQVDNVAVDPTGFLYDGTTTIYDLEKQVN